MSELTEERLAEFSKIHTAAIDKLVEIENKDWEVVKKEPEITFYRRFDPDSPFAQVKSVVTVPNSTFDDVSKELDPILEVNESTPPKQKHGLDFSRLIASSGDASLIYIALTSPAVMVSARDFILFRKKVERDGKLYFINVSVPDDTIVPPTKGYVRAHMSYQGFIAEQTGDDIKLTFIAHADPKGKIPAWAYNQVSTFQGYSAKGIRKRIIANHENK